MSLALKQASRAKNDGRKCRRHGGRKPGSSVANSASAIPSAARAPRWQDGPHPACFAREPDVAGGGRLAMMACPRAAGTSRAWNDTGKRNVLRASRRTAHFRGPAIRVFSVNAATAATNLNAIMVNARSGVLKLPVFWQKNAVWGRFLALKNTVNYSNRFELTMRFRFC